jgi:hypothetical protein
LSAAALEAPVILQAICSGAGEDRSYRWIVRDSQSGQYNAPTVRTVMEFVAAIISEDQDLFIR